MVRLKPFFEDVADTLLKRKKEKIEEDMKQQTIADSVIKDLFGVSGRDFQEIKQTIAGLQKGELIVKDNTLAELGLSNKVYKKIKVTHLI